MKILYIDMDNVLVDFRSAFSRVDPALLKQFENDKDEIPGIFSLMDPMPGAIEAVTFLHQHFDLYILSTAPWENPSAWIDKLLWIQKHLPEIAYKKLILSHHKNLNKGDYIVDDRTKRGVDQFEGEHIHFGEDGNFKSWKQVEDYLIQKEGIVRDEKDEIISPKNDVEIKLAKEDIKKDEILEFHRGRIRIKDCIFEYHNRAEDINIEGDVNPDLSKKYPEIDTDVFSVSIGKSLIYNEEVDRNYIGYRLIELNI